MEKRKLKNGFTILELIVVMSIILVVSVSSVVAYTRMTTSYKEKEYNRLISEFEAAAETYVALNRDMREIIYSGSGYATITLKALREEGLVDDDAKDPITGAKFEDRYYVSVYLDENKNLHAVFMREAASSFTNARAKQSVLAGSLYTRVQMLEYIVGYTRGEYDEVNSSYGTKEIDYSRVIIQVTDVTNIDSTFVVSNSNLDTSKIGRKYKLKYSYDFGNDGVKTLEREIEIFDVNPTIKSVTLNPDVLRSYTNENVTVIVSAETVQDSLKYHYVVNGVDHESNNASYVMTDNGTLNIYVEDPYGAQSTPYMTQITYIDRTAPTATISVKEKGKYGAYIEVSDLNDSASGLPREPIYYSSLGKWTAANVEQIKRNGTYSVTIKDNIGNEKTEFVTVSNIVMDNMIGKDKTEIQTLCSKYEITCNFAGSTNAYAVATYQSISPNTPITDGMVLNLTMEKPIRSVKVNLGYASTEENTNLVFGTSTEQKTINLVPLSGYEFNSTSISCSSSVNASITSNVLTITGVSGNVTCTVTAKKSSISYDN